MDLHLTLRPTHEFPLEDGMEVLRWSGPGWPNIREYSMQFDVVFGEPDRYAGASLLDIAGQNVAAMLRHIGDAVYVPDFRK